MQRKEPFSKRKYSLFLGCLPPLRYPGIESSARLVLKHFNIPFEEMRGASCCPAPGVIKPLNEELWLTLAARNLSLAEKVSGNLLTLCNGCFFSLNEAAEILRNNCEKLEKINMNLANVGKTYAGQTEVYHFVDVLYEDVGLEKLQKSVVKPLKRV